MTIPEMTELFTAAEGLRPEVRAMIYRLAPRTIGKPEERLSMLQEVADAFRDAPQLSRFHRPEWCPACDEIGRVVAEESTRNLELAIAERGMS